MPGFLAPEYIYRNDEMEAVPLKIPVHPIGYRDAEKLLK